MKEKELTVGSGDYGKDEDSAQVGRRPHWAHSLPPSSPLALLLAGDPTLTTHFHPPHRLPSSWQETPH